MAQSPLGSLPPARSASPWQITAGLAKFTHAQATARCHLPELNRGLIDWTLAGRSIPADLLAPQGLQPGHDAYAREGDLVVTIPASEHDPFRTQIYWRMVPSQSTALAVCETIISRQTDLLDSDPKFTLRSTLPAAELWHLQSGAADTWQRVEAGEQITSAPGVYLIRLPSADLSYAEFVHPRDFIHSQLELTGARATLTHELFTHRLEKGVILRARVQGRWLNRKDDQTNAARLYETFANSEPPLTT